jgi:hypothetical protein
MLWAGRPQAAPTARLDRRECRLGVDAIEKVENRKPTKISRKSFFGHCCCRTVLWSQYKKASGRWYESMWALGRRALSASAVFKIFVFHPKRTYSTASVIRDRVESAASLAVSAMPRRSCSADDRYPVVRVHQHGACIAGTENDTSAGREASLRARLTPSWTPKACLSHSASRPATFVTTDLCPELLTGLQPQSMLRADSQSLG